MQILPLHPVLLAQSRTQTSLEALDATMALVSAAVNPVSGGAVWAGKYGVRGGGRDFIVQVLEGAAPEPVTTAVLMNLAARQFGLVLTTHLERRNFNKSVMMEATGS